MNVSYPDLEDYLALAAEVTGLDLVTLLNATNLDLADSALHAPAAGFGDQDLYPDLCRQVSSPRRPSGQESSAAGWQPARSLGDSPAIYRSQRLAVVRLSLSRRSRAGGSVDCLGRLGSGEGRSVAQASDHSLLLCIAGLDRVQLPDLWERHLRHFWVRLSLRRPILYPGSTRSAATRKSC